MKANNQIVKASLLLALAATLNGCDGDEQKNPGVGHAPRPERVSPATNCLRQHPAFQVRSFPDSMSAVKAFFRASVDCKPNEEEMGSFGQWLEARGVSIEQAGGNQ